VFAFEGRAAAQAAAERPKTVFVTIGAGSFGDDEGSLGGGVVAGGGAGGRITDRIRIEVAVSTTRHSQLASISWEGRPTVVTGRGLYLFGSTSSRARVFAGAGLGGGHYAGTRTDTIVDRPGAPPRLERVSYSVNGIVTEVGGGVDVGLGSRLFMRPEAWLVMMGGKATHGLEPTLLMPRSVVSVGTRF